MRHNYTRPTIIALAIALLFCTVTSQVIAQPSAGLPNVEATPPSSQPIPNVEATAPSSQPTRNDTHRVVNNTKYKILEQEGFPIYAHQAYVNAAKGSMISRLHYSFSKDANSEVYPLTRANLKKVFPGKTEFHYALDAQFRNDKQLTAYDKYQKMFKVTYLFLKN